jgi:hypothetical protein
MHPLRQRLRGECAGEADLYGTNCAVSDPPPRGAWGRGTAPVSRLRPRRRADTRTAILAGWKGKAVDAVHVTFPFHRIGRR